MMFSVLITKLALTINVRAAIDSDTFRVMSDFETSWSLPERVKLCLL